MLNQVANRTLKRTAINNYLSTAPDEEPWVFCKNIISNRKEVTTNYNCTSDGALLIKSK